MNTFKKLAISIVFLGITLNVFSQQVKYKSYKEVDIPFYDENTVRSSFLKQQTAFDTIWLPASIIEIARTGDTASRHIYEYHGNGLLKKTSTYAIRTGDLYAFGYYNNTYLDPLMDITDTIFYAGYIHPITGEYYPPYRYYYNNHQADSSYWEEYYQEWDGENWNTEEKTYVHLLDMATTVSEFQDHVEIFNREGRKVNGWKIFLTLDEQGNVTEALIELYDAFSGQYKISGKAIYLYDDEGKCHTRDYYAYYSGTWHLEGRLSDMKWFEFHGFDNGDMLFYGNVIGNYKFGSFKNKNKISSFKYWAFNGSLYLHDVDTMEWKTEPLSYHYFNYSAYNMCLDVRYYSEYNEHHHLAAYGQWAYHYSDCDPNSNFYLTDDYINKYDERGRRYEYIINQEVFRQDSLFNWTYIYVIDSFTYVGNVGIHELPLDKQTLLIVPNPADETVRITAADSIATLTLYASDGRLAYSREGSGKEMTINLHELSKGVYIAQARLKDGRIQTGKVVVR